MAQPRRAPPRLVEVVNKKQMTPNMLRVTFGGQALLGFPTDAASANIKLLLPHEDQDDTAYRAALLGDGKKPIKRTYTVVAYRENNNELDIDFALHANAGPATTFATQAQIGDRVGIAGPSSTKLVDVNAEWFLIAGDMTALPAIEANIKKLPANAAGFIVIEVQDNADKRSFTLPNSLNINWLINPEPQYGKSELAEVVMNLAWPTGKPYVWIAGEVSTVRTLHTYFAKTKELEPQHRYTSAYWQIGENEDAFQRVKRQITG